MRRFDRRLLAPLLLLVLAASAFVPGVHLDVRSPSGQSMVETATTLIAALAAALLFGRFWRHAGLRDLLIGCGLATVATSNLATYVLFANHVQPAGYSPAWLALGGWLTGWLLIALAALLRDRPVLRNQSEAIRVGVANAGVIAGLATLAVALSAGVAASASMGHGSFADPTAAVITQLLTALLAGIATFGFARQGGRSPDLTLRLMIFSAALAVGASLAFCASPALYEARIGNGDILRIGSLLALLFCVSVEWLLDERRAITRVIAHERRRMAADVHDLIMQDLSFALANARMLADGSGRVADDSERASQAGTVVEAGERALAGARDVLSGLTRQDTKPFVEAVEAGVRAASRNGRLRFNADGVGPYEQPDELTRDALLHISREAVTNATKHARPTTAIEVTLAYHEDWRLTIRDEGRGFDAANAGGGFGLRSMHERASALGGSLRVVSAAGHGTTVLAVLP